MMGKFYLGVHEKMRVIIYVLYHPLFHCLLFNLQ